MRRSVLLSLAAVALFAVVPTHAHHTFMSTYFQDRTQTIAGTLVQITFRNPHSVVLVDSPDEHGRIHRWTIEWGAALQLNHQDVTPETLKVGDRVTITGHPGRNPDDHRLRLRTIVRPSDGWRWRGTFE